MAIPEDLKTIARQEETLRFAAFDEHHAWSLGSRLRDVCVGEGHPVAIEIRRFSQPLFFSALPGTSPDNVEWVRRKANTVARFHRSSYSMGLELAGRGQTLEERFGLTLENFAAHGGAFPLHVKGTGVIGSVAVSGLPQRQDHELVVQVLCEILSHSYPDLKLADEA